MSEMRDWIPAPAVIPLAPRLDPIQITFAAELWAKGKRTDQIAEKLSTYGRYRWGKIVEASVANSIDDIKREAK
jgi:hypothetical protein